MRESRGFTLIETLIYLALFAIIIGGGLVVAYQIIESSDKNTNKVIVQEEANFLLRKIGWALNGLNSITSPAAGSKINFPTSATANFCVNKIRSNLVEIYVNSGDMFIRTGGACGSGGTTFQLNSDNITLASSTFEHIPASGTGPEAVRAAFSFTNSSQYFETTKYLRK